MLIAGACLCWGIDNNLTRKLSSADPVQIAMLKGLVAGAVNLALALVAGRDAAARPAPLAAAGVVGFLGYGVSLALFVLGLRHLGTARTGAYFSLAPFVGAVLAVAMLGEPLSVQLARRRRPDGLRPLAASGRTARARTCPRSRWSTSTGIVTTRTTSTSTS